MICKNCGAELQNDDTFCAACGEDCINKEKEAVQCSECGKFFNKEFGMCPFCGTELVEDRIEQTDNQDIPLSVTDTEEAFVEENTESNFGLCPNCNNKFDINVGLCTICGYSSFELDETVAEEDEASANVSAIEDSTSDKLQNAYNSAYNDTEENKPVNYKKIGIISAIVIGIIIVIALIVNGSKLSGVSMNQIESDISELSVVTNGVIESEYTPFTPYTVDSVEIEKRQTNIDDKEDIVYCNVVISNEYYQTDLQIKLVYNYYDDGGWIKDGSSVVSDTTIPIAPIPIDSVDKITVTALKTKIDLTSSYITDITLDDDSYTYTSTINYKYSDDRFVVEGYATAYFENNEWLPIRSDDFVLTSAVPNWESEKCRATRSEHRYSDTWIYCKPGAEPIITSLYIVEESQKNNRDKYYQLQKPDFNYTFKVTKVDTKSNKVRGTLTLEGDNKTTSTPDFEKTVKIEFYEDFNTSTGNFTIDETIGMCCYYKGGWLSDSTDVHFVPMKIQVEVDYSFYSQEWNLNFKIIEKVEKNGKILCTYNDYWENTW